MIPKLTLKIFFLDVNECGNDINNCHANASCINTDGNFTCSCISGFTGNGIICNGKIFAKKFFKYTG